MGFPGTVAPGSGVRGGENAIKPSWNSGKSRPPPTNSHKTLMAFGCHVSISSRVGRYLLEDFKHFPLGFKTYFLISSNLLLSLD